LEIIAAVVAQIPAGTVLDGELVVYWDGRCDFTISACFTD
jgi:hypothetical protein